MNDTRPPPRLLCTTYPVDHGRGAVRMEDVHDTDAVDLWSALTTPDRLSRWIGEVHGDLRLGGEFHARLTSGWEGPGRVEVCRPPERLVVRLAPGTTEETRIEAILLPEGDQTRLVIEERGIPLGELTRHGAGWQAHAEDLHAHVTGQPRQDWRTRWLELTPVYDAARRDPR